MNARYGISCVLYGPYHDETLAYPKVKADPLAFFFFRKQNEMYNLQRSLEDSRSEEFVLGVAPGGRRGRKLTTKRKSEKKITRSEGLQMTAYHCSFVIRHVDVDMNRVNEIASPPLNTCAFRISYPTTTANNISTVQLS